MLYRDARNDDIASPLEAIHEQRLGVAKRLSMDLCALVESNGIV